MPVVISIAITVAIAIFSWLVPIPLFNGLWIVLGLAALTGAMVLIQRLPAYKKLATVLFLAFAFFFFLYPRLATWVGASWPLTSIALRQGQQYADNVSAELASVEAQRAKDGLLEFCRWLDANQSQWVNRQFAELRRSLEPPPPPSFWRRWLGATPAPTRPVFPDPDPKLVQAMANLIPVIANYREKCRVAAMPEAGAAKIADQLKSWPERIADWFTGNSRLVFWTVITLLLAALVVAAVTGQVKVWPAAKGGAMLVFAALIANWLIWGGGLGRLGLGDSPRASVGGAYTIPLDDKKEVEIAALFPARWCYSISGTPGTEKTVITFRDGGTDTLGIDKEFGRNRYPASFRGSGTLYAWVYRPDSRGCRRG